MHRMEKPTLHASLPQILMRVDVLLIHYIEYALAFCTPLAKVNALFPFKLDSCLTSSHFRCWRKKWFSCEKFSLDLWKYRFVLWYWTGLDRPPLLVTKQKRGSDHVCLDVRWWEIGLCQSWGGSLPLKKVIFTSFMFENSCVMPRYARYPIIVLSLSFYRHSCLWFLIHCSIWPFHYVLYQHSIYLQGKTSWMVTSVWWRMSMHMRTTDRLIGRKASCEKNDSSSIMLTLQTFVSI